jgi:hypothetical protein
MITDRQLEQVRERQIREYFQHKPADRFIAFDLMIQFIDRCIADGKDPTPFRNAAIYIACGCSVDGKSNAPAATGGRSMPSLNYLNPWAL